MKLGMVAYTMGRDMMGPCYKYPLVQLSSLPPRGTLKMLKF
jgi:hypothetical protein